MRTPILAMIWELIRLSRWEWLGRIVFGGGFLVLLFRMGTDPAAIELGNETGRSTIASLAMTTLLISSLFSTVWLRSFSGQVGFVFQLGFARPVTTRLLVLVPLAFVVLSSVSSFAIPAAGFRMATGYEFPVLVPSVLVGLLAVILAAGVWSCTSTLGQIFYLVFALLLAASFVAGMVADPDSELPVLLRLVDPGRLVLLQWAILLPVAAAIAATWNCLRSVELQRRGDRQWFGFRLADKVAAKQAAVVNLLTHTSPASLQRAWVWRFWRVAGRSVVVTSSLVTLAGAILVTVGEWSDPGDEGRVFWATMIAMGTMAWMLLSTIWISGSFKAEGIVAFPLFDAVLPIRPERFLLNRIAAVCVLAVLGTLVMIGGYVIQRALTGQLVEELGLLVAFAERMAERPVYEVVGGLLFVPAVFVTAAFAVVSQELYLPVASRYWGYAIQAVVVLCALLVVAGIQSQVDLSAVWQGMIYAFALLWVFVALGCLRTTWILRPAGKVYYVLAAILWPLVVLPFAVAAFRVREVIPEVQALNVASAIAIAVSVTMIGLLLAPIGLNRQLHRR